MAAAGPSAPAATAPPRAFLDSLPAWAAELVRAVWSKQANTFVLHGVPSDLVAVGGAAAPRFVALDEFLVGTLFAGWSSILTYNRAEGIGFATAPAR